MLGPFWMNSVVSISRPMRVIVSTLREWMMLVCLKPCSYFFARAMAVSTSRHADERHERHHLLVIDERVATRPSRRRAVPCRPAR